MSCSGCNASRSLIALVALAWAVGCDPSVTSVGAWEPVSRPVGGRAGSAGSVMVSGAGGSGAAPAAGGAEANGDASGFYLEAEDGELSGFSVVEDAAASNGQYIRTPTGPASDTTPVVDTPRARYRFELAEAGDYVIWGRIYSPDVSRNRFWFQVDGGAWHIWRITVGEIWFWDDFHVDTDYENALHFALEAGSHELTIAKDASLARLDRLYLTAGGDEPPGNDTPCNPPHTIDRGGGVCAPSCGSLAPAGMHTSCLADVCAGQQTLEVYDCNVCCIVP